MKASKLIFLILILPIISSCASTTKDLSSSDDRLLVQDSFSLVAPANLTKSELQDDVSVLTYAFENGYGGRKYIPSDQYRKTLSSLYQLSHDATEVIDTREFCRAIAQSLFELSDNHLSARMTGQECNEEHEKLFSKGSVGKNSSTQNDIPWDLSYRTFGKTRIPILSITAMPAHEDKAWTGFIDAVLMLKRSAPAIVIDLRGNGGGDDKVGREMAKILYGQNFPSPWEVIIKSQTAATYALAANSSHLKILRLKRKGIAPPDYLTKRFEENLTNFKSAQSGRLPVEKIEAGQIGTPFNPKNGYTKPIYILIDKGCQSSCESIVEAFEAHPHAVRVGENTGGFIHFGNMGQLVLPHSQIIIQMATDYWKRRDGKFLEKVGYSPRIAVPSGKDALDYALDDLRQKPLR